MPRSQEPSDKQQGAQLNNSSRLGAVWALRLPALVLAVTCLVQLLPLQPSLNGHQQTANLLDTASLLVSTAASCQWSTLLPGTSAEQHTD